MAIWIGEEHGVFTRGVEIGFGSYARFGQERTAALGPKATLSATLQSGHFFCLRRKLERRHPCLCMYAGYSLPN